MAAKKKNSTVNKSSAGNKRAIKSEKLKRKKMIRKLELIFLYLLVVVLLFLSFYSELIGISGVFIKNMFKGILGNSAYLLPFILIYAFIYYYIQKRKNEGYLKIYAISAFLVLLSSLFHLYNYKNVRIPIKIERFYIDSINGFGGGIIGGFIAEPLKIMLSYPGAFILLLLTIIFITIVIFNEFIMKAIEYLKERKKEVKDNPHKKEVKEKKKKVKKQDEIEEPIIEADPKTDFNKIMEIYNEYENEVEAKDDLEAGIELLNKTQAEIELDEEKQELDRILSLNMDKKSETVEVEDKVEQIIIKPENKKIEYKYPSIELLDDNTFVSNRTKDNMSVLKENSIKLEEILRSFGVEAEVVNIEKGPSITRFELQPKTGVRLSKIQSLQDDIKMNLAATSIRIAPIPGKTVVGVEVPNDKTIPVYIKEIIASKEFQSHKSKISFTVGKDITGRPIVGDLSKMPHVLIAGATGSGKSVCINALITSILYKANPNEVKLIMIDPKVVELGIYNGIPHLLIPVVTDPKKAAGALNWAVVEMQNRYKLFAEAGVRNIEGYNEFVKSEGEEDRMLPQIVIIIDELSDLMMVAPKDIESYICRLAQLARAAGMHLVIATQRPSVNVITGLIKANVPSRIAFAVTSQIDSRTILDMGGAEKLLGKGDMLYYPVGETKPIRVQGSLITDKEVERIVNVVKANSTAEYDEDVIEHVERAQSNEADSKSKENEALDADEMLPQAIDVILENNQASVSLLQRKLKLGYARAARIIDQMEARGLVGPSEGSKPRQILITREQFYEMQMNN